MAVGVRFVPEAIVSNSDLSECAREPIHVPGSIQPHGFLFILNPDLTIAAASKNAADALDILPTDLIGKPIAKVLALATNEPLDVALQSQQCGAPLHICFRRPGEVVDWDARVRSSEGMLLLELGPLFGSESAEALLGGVCYAIERIRMSGSPQLACENLAAEIRRLNGFDRVMIYRFDRQWNGEVIAEDKSEDATSYLGHSFPASDIPVQARALYTRNPVRQIPDAAYTPSPLIPSFRPSTGKPFDLSLATLRSVSPVHLEYLANMGVAASMSVSILRDGELWGLVACHHHAPRTLPNAVLQGCELLAQAAAWYLAMHERSAAAEAVEIVRRLEARLQSTEGIQDYRTRLEAIAPDMLIAVKSQGIAFCNGRSVWRVGQVPTDDDVIALAAWLPGQSDEAFATDQLSLLFPPAEKYRALASGVAARKLPSGWLIWFRSEWPHTLTWAGNPSEMLKGKPGQGRINPRKSFASWRNSVRGQSRPWTTYDNISIDEIRLLVLRTILVDQMHRLVENERALLAAKDAAEAANLSKSRFLANMSHELRTPLNVVLGFSDIMRGDPNGTKVQEYAGYIYDSGQHLLDLINDVLDLAKIEAGKYQLNLERVNPREIVDDIVRSLSLKLAQAEVSFDPPAKGALPDLMADQRALKQVLLNLLSNAIKFTPKGGRISLRIGVIGEALRMTVADTGVGMSPDMLSRVGQPFERSDDGYDRRTEGTGLGLALTKTLVELHGGTTEFTSTLGRGTSVSITFPIGSARERQQAR